MRDKTDWGAPIQCPPRVRVLGCLEHHEIESLQKLLLDRYVPHDLNDPHPFSCFDNYDIKVANSSLRQNVAIEFLICQAERFADPNKIMIMIHVEQSPVWDPDGFKA